MPQIGAHPQPRVTIFPNWAWTVATEREHVAVFLELFHQFLSMKGKRPIMTVFKDDPFRLKVFADLAQKVHDLKRFSRNGVLVILTGCRMNRTGGCVDDSFTAHVGVDKGTRTVLVHVGNDVSIAFWINVNADVLVSIVPQHVLAAVDDAVGATTQR